MAKAVIIGGTKGLGLEIAKLLTLTHDVTVTGRKEPLAAGLDYYPLELFQWGLSQRIEGLIRSLPKIDMLVFSAGFYQEGILPELSEPDIDDMISVGLGAPAKILRKVLQTQITLPVFVAITSTSATTPRPKEPVYSMVKAGLSMFARSTSQQNGVSKTLEVAPGGMKTGFWDETDKDISNMLEPSWVAEVALAQLQGDYSYRYVEILRDPPTISKIYTVI